MPAVGKKMSAPLYIKEVGTSCARVCVVESNGSLFLHVYIEYKVQKHDRLPAQTKERVGELSNEEATRLLKNGSSY